MAGVFAESPAAEPWTRADVFIFKVGVPADASQVQMLTDSVSILILCSGTSLCPPKRSPALVSQVGSGATNSLE